MDVNRHIRRKIRVKGPHCLPYTGWLNSNRTHIYEIFAELGYKIGAEVGVQGGRNALAILQKNPNVKLYLIDPWTPYGHMSQEKQDAYLDYARKLLLPYQDQVIFKRQTSMDALKDFQDNSLDFVYIDGLHDFDNVMMDLIGWNQKVKSGGIVSGHDYIHLHYCGIIPAVNAFIEGHDIKEWYLTRDYKPAPSFFWVKP